MGRRRRKRFSARTGAQPPRGLPRAPIGDVVAAHTCAGPVGPSSAAPKRQKRNLSNPPNDDKKRQKFAHAQDVVTSEIKEQEENRNDVTHDDVIHRRSAISHDCPATAKEEEEEDGREDEVPILVTCNRNDGLLYLSKLRVVVNERCRKKCIRTGNTWWTPNEFQVVSGRGAAKDWKRTVKHSGQRLKSLLTNGVLCLNTSPPKCLCKPCCQLTETGREIDSPEEERREDVGDVGTASEAAYAVDDVKRRAKGGEEGVKKPGLRMIRIHRRGRRHVNDTVDRKSGPHALPVKKKSRKLEAESDSNVARDGRSRGRPKKSLVFRLSSASFEAVVCRPTDADDDENGANSSPMMAPKEAFEGRCSDRDASEEVIPSDQTKPTDDIPNEHSTCKSPSDDVIADVTESFRREDSGAEISSRETKAEGCLITGNDEILSASMTSLRCEKRVAKEPKEHASTRSAHASPTVDIPEASSDASCTVDVTSGGSVKSSNRNVTDGENDVMRVTVAAVTSPPWSSATSATNAPRRKRAHLDAVIAELKWKKRSKEGSVPASAPVYGGGGMEEQRSMAAGTLKAKLPTTTCSDLMKMETNLKTTSFEAIRCPLASSASSSGLPGPAFEASSSLWSDVKPICLNPTGDRNQNPATESKTGLRRTVKESSEGKWKKTTAPLIDHPPGWTKDEGSGSGLGSEVGRRFWMSSGGMTSDPMTSNSALNFSQLASMYGLNAASPMTSFPLPPTQMSSFPFFPPYLFMGFPLQPLLPPPHFSSSSSSLPSGVPSSGPETSFPVPVGSVSGSAISGSAPQNRKRRTQQSHKSPSTSSKESKSFPQMSSSSPGTDSGLWRTALSSSSSSSSSSFSPSDLHLWRRLATDFSAHAWATGSALAATGSSKSHSGSTARHPIWRPAVASQSASSREYVEATIPHMPFVHAQRQAEVTSVAGTGGNKNESSMLADFTRKLCSGDKMEETDGFGGITGSSGTGKYSSDCEGVLDLSKK